VLSACYLRCCRSLLPPRLQTITTPDHSPLLPPPTPPIKPQQGTNAHVVTAPVEEGLTGAGADAPTSDAPTADAPPTACLWERAELWVTQPATPPAFLSDGFCL